MTDLKDTLAALSEVAEPDNLRSMAIVLRQCEIAFGGVKQTALGERAATALDQLALLASAYRSGQLVPVPSVDVVAEIIFYQQQYHGKSTAQIATAIIAAMKGEGRGDV